MGRLAFGLASGLSLQGYHSSMRALFIFAILAFGLAAGIEEDDRKGFGGFGGGLSTQGSFTMSGATGGWEELEEDSSLGDSDGSTKDSKVIEDSLGSAESASGELVSLDAGRNIALRKRLSKVQRARRAAMHLQAARSLLQGMEDLGEASHLEGMGAMPSVSKCLNVLRSATSKLIGENDRLEKEKAALLRETSTGSTAKAKKKKSASKKAKKAKKKAKKAKKKAKKVVKKAKKVVKKAAKKGTPGVKKKVKKAVKKAKKA